MRQPGMLVAICVVAGCRTSEPAQDIGALAFADPGLSEPVGQACADCHAPAAKFRDPESDRSTSAGAIPTRFGPRNSPTVLYAAAIPPRHVEGDRVIGGLFWDGRASSLEEQAAGPLLNPLEMNNPDKTTVVDKLRAAAYAPAFVEIYGEGALDDDDVAFRHLTEALATYERSPALSPFTSRYDRYIAGTAKLTDAELGGLAVFQRACSSCHPPPMFTDYSYANVGIPRYANSKFFRQPPELNPDGDLYVDRGLGAITGDARDDGTFRVPTLRNIARTAPYGHNGYFENLPYMLDFLNTRDVGSERNGPWASPEIGANVTAQVGHLQLTAAEQAELVAFLGTLTDE